MSGLAELGPNVTAYFKLGKMLAILYFFLLLLCIPLILVTYNGGNDGSISSNPLASTTMGNVAGVNGTSFLALPIVGLTPLLATSIFYGALDAGIVLLAFAAFLWGKIYIAREKKQVQQKSLTLQNYSVYLRNVPPLTTERDIHRWLQGLIEKEEQMGALDVYQIVCDTNKQYRERPRDDSFDVVEPTADKRETLRNLFKLQSVAIIPSHALVEALVPKLGPQEAALLSKEGQIIGSALARDALTKTPSLSSKLSLMMLPTKQSLVKDLAVLHDKREKNNLELNALLAKNAQGGKKLFPSTGAFLSFERACYFGSL